MKILGLLIVLSLFSFNSYAEKCEGINACADLYSKLTAVKLVSDKNLSDEMSLAVPGADLTNENARSEFLHFLNKNAVKFVDNKMSVTREGEYISAPIYVVSENNMPQMINKDGLVTLVYQAKKDTKKLISSKVIKLSSRKKFSKTIEYKDTRVIAVCDTFEHATKMMNEIMKADK